MRAERPRPSKNGPIVARWGWVFGAALATLALETPAAADAPPTSASQASEAKRQFMRGSELYLGRHYADALEHLRESYRLVPSPNSGLVIARCLRDLGRNVEAQEMFTAVEVEARRRSEAGETKYARTADTAAAEGALVRATLGALRVHVDRASDDGTRLEIDSVATPIPADGNVLAWHTPGEVIVSVRPPLGMEQRQTVTVSAGSEVKMDFNLTPPAPPPASGAVPLPTPLPSPPSNGPQIIPRRGPPPAPAGDAAASSSSWEQPAAWISGAVTVIGFGLFAGFGLESQAQFRDLSARCGPSNCGPADRPEASAGKRNQVIADVALVAGSVAAAATITFITLSLTSARPSRGSATPLRVFVAGASFGLRADFD